MPTFERGEIVRVPFPFVDRNTTRFRPAVVVASGLGIDGLLTWVMMVTSAENRAWPGDVAIADHTAAGLPIPSIIRTSKVATILSKRAERRGKLQVGDLAAMESELAARLKLPPSGWVP